MCDAPGAGGTDSSSGIVPLRSECFMFYFGSHTCDAPGASETDSSSGIVPLRSECFMFYFGSHTCDAPGVGGTDSSSAIVPRRSPPSNPRTSYFIHQCLFRLT